MIFVRVLALVLGALANLTAPVEAAQNRAAGAKQSQAQKKLVAFVESGGCKVLAIDGAVKRFKDVDAQGKVTWDGECKNGLIEGRGVLREEGAVAIKGRTKHFVYHVSGTARKGMRTGRWVRETFDMFAGSPRYYTSAATWDFVDGIATGRPRPFPVRDVKQFTPAFQTVIAAARAKLESTAKPVPSVAVAPPAAAAKVAAPKITASSQAGDFGPGGLLASTPPGWHSASPPIYPEVLTVDFIQRREIKALALQAQRRAGERAPKVLNIEISDDGRTWIAAAGSDDACTPNTPDGWSNIAFAQRVTTRYLRIMVFANCGDPQVLTLRGLRFE